MAKNPARHAIFHKKHKGQRLRERNEQNALQRKVEKSAFANGIAWFLTFVIMFAIVGGILFLGGKFLWNLVFNAI